MPLLTDLLADKSGSPHLALLLPAICYGTIAPFGIYAVERRTGR
jgi:FHS family L-fucose permease-like MFS transporter